MTVSRICRWAPRALAGGAAARCRERRKSRAAALLLDEPIPIPSCRLAAGFSRAAAAWTTWHQRRRSDTLMPRVRPAVAARARGVSRIYRKTLELSRKKVSAFAAEVPLADCGNAD